MWSSRENFQVIFKWISSKMLGFFSPELHMYWLITIFYLKFTCIFFMWILCEDELYEIQMQNVGNFVSISSKYLVRLFLKFLPNHKQINKQTKVPFIPVLPFFLVLGFASAKFWQMSEEKKPTMSLTPVWQKQFLYDYCVSQSCWKPYRSCQQGRWKFVWTSKTISIRICCESEFVEIYRSCQQGGWKFVWAKSFL